MVLLENPKFEEIFEIIGKRQGSFSELEMVVREIVNKVKTEKDRALEEFIGKYEKCSLKVSDLPVSRAEFESAAVEDEFDMVLDEVIRDLEEFHRRQLENSFFYTTSGGSLLGEMVVPLESVGIYVPGGKAPYFSTLLMCAVPARVAGVNRIVVATPPDENGNVSPYILRACEKLEIREVYKMGGAHAVAALSYGTESINPVDKIVGPGGIFVSLAKKIVFGDVGIDSVAGPSELLIITDGSAPLDFVAADFLSQAEHDENAMCVVITNSREVFEKLPGVVEQQLGMLPEERRKTARVSVERFGTLIFVEDLKEGFEISNTFAPEHLELLVERPFELLGLVKSAGSVFLGRYTCEAVGDYGIGPNHVLPTFRSARFTSGLRVSDFTKKIFVTHMTKEDFESKYKRYSKMARWEGFEAHARSIDVRGDTL